MLRRIAAFDYRRTYTIFLGGTFRNFWRVQPSRRLIHVFLDKARYHHARLVQEWLARQGQRIRLHFVPTYSPHLNPIERLWGVMHKNVTHNQGYATAREFRAAILGFLTQNVPKQWHVFRDHVTDKFRVINPADFRILR